MTLDLTSAYAKLTWAESLTQEVKKEIHVWAESAPAAFVSEKSDDGKEHRIVFKVVKEPNLHRWSLMIADAFHNLRCSLDHLVYAIAIHQHKQNPPRDETRLMFPLHDSAEEFERRGRNRISSLSVAVQAAIERAQPYKRPHAGLRPPLSLLAFFNNSDKHRLLKLAYVALNQGDFSLSYQNDSAASGFQNVKVGELITLGPDNTLILKGAGEPVRLVFVEGPIKNNSAVVTVTFVSPKPTATVEAKFNVKLALSHQPGPDGNECTDYHILLTLIAKEIKDVIDLVEAEVK
jgi:hypothetical protein